MSTLQEQINAIQNRHNFSPAAGARQVHEADREDYSALVELVEKAKNEGTEVYVPYDALGLTPLSGVRIPVSEVRMGKLTGPRQRPIAPRKGTFAYTKWKLEQVHAQHPEVPHADLLWASKRADIEKSDELIRTAKTRVRQNGA